MSSNTFERGLAFVLEHEGGYSNDPSDPGGETNYGISRRSHPDVDIKALTREKAAQIYQQEYWTRPGFDRLPPRIGICVFDMAVNMGVLTAIRQLQVELAVSADGVIGDLTVRAAQDREERGLLAGYCTRRILRYTILDSWKRYGTGWVRRVLDLHTLALTL